TPRTRLETRAIPLANQTVTTTHWNAEIRQRVEGLEEHTVDRPLAAPRIAAPLEARWVAHGWAMELSGAPPGPNGAGWSVKEALLMRTYCASEDVVVTYDVDSQSLWLIETAPGGTGIAQWILEHVEELLVLARAIVRGSEANDLFRSLALRERAWLDPLLDPAAEQAPVQHSTPTTPKPEQRSIVSPTPVRERETVQPIQLMAAPVQARPPARSRVYAASKKVAQLASSMEQPVIEEPAQSERAMSGQHVYEETVDYDVSVGARSAVVAPEEHDVSSTSPSVVEEGEPIEASEVVEEPYIPTHDELSVAAVDDGGNSRIYDALDARTRSDMWSNESASAENPASPNDHDMAIGSTDEGTGTDSDPMAWEAVAPSDVPFAVSPPSRSTNTVEATWRLDEPEQEPEVEDVRWAANDPVHDIED
ncbi:MAG: hypothetical protein AVDCRST_MAG93-299, partial [uncultured Chloroflexia bacterium]